MVMLASTYCLMICVEYVVNLMADSLDGKYQLFKDHVLFILRLTKVGYHGPVDGAIAHCGFSSP
jgi:hypothetical protein